MTRTISTLKLWALSGAAIVGLAGASLTGATLAGAAWAAEPAQDAAAAEPAVAEPAPSEPVPSEPAPAKILAAPEAEAGPALQPVAGRPIEDTARIAPNLNPEIEVVFVLDTTGSMSSLIDGAKRKIWSIASEILETKHQAKVKFGLIGYRDRGDDYVTRKYDLTEDINGIYGHLLEFQAEGGGDTPESVNQALNEAIVDMGWSDDERTLRMVFLVGDAPPKEDYDNDVDWDVSIDLANRLDIMVNTVLAGNDGTTRGVWKAMAKLGGGSFAEIPQDGGMQTIVTPYDDQIDQLQRQINDTVLPYGGQAEKEYLTRQMSDAMAAPAPVASDMAAVRMKSGKMNRVLTGGNDLVEDYEDGAVDLNTIETDALPDDLKALPKAELKSKLDEQVQKRAGLNAEMVELVKQRDAFIEVERDKLEAGGEDAFDSTVEAIIVTGAARKGIEYKD